MSKYTQMTFLLRAQINIDYHIKGRQCSDVKHIGSLKISNYYKRLLESWSFLLESQTLYVKEDILDQKFLEMQNLAITVISIF